MTTSPARSTTPDAPQDEGLRVRFSDDPARDGVEGWWWPRSRDLQHEAADLVDHFPHGRGRISRPLFSRPDWDDASHEGRGVRKIWAGRGPVKTGSFPHDDTQLMVLAMSSAPDVRLAVVREAASDVLADGS